MSVSSYPWRVIFCDTSGFPAFQKESSGTTSKWNGWLSGVMSAAITHVSPILALGDSSESGAKVLTDEQARDAVWKYICTEENPSLEEYDGEASVYCCVSSEEGADEIRIDFRSYTGSHEYFYIDRATGDTHSTQYVPGIIDEEEDTGLSINVWDYVEK